LDIGRPWLPYGAVALSPIPAVNEAYTGRHNQATEPAGCRLPHLLVSSAADCGFGISGFALIRFIPEAVSVFFDFEKGVLNFKNGFYKVTGEACPTGQSLPHKSQKPKGSFLIVGDFLQ
jgi:hypothetical protein